MYVGEWVRGLIANLGFVAVVEVFLLFFAALKFFPLLPIVVLCFFWALFVLFAARSARNRIGTNEYILKPYNHPLMYGLFALITFFAPVLATLQFTATQLVSPLTVNSAGMIPTLRPGDVVLIDRTAFKARLPTRGEMIAAQSADDTLLLRAIAVAGDAVRFEGDVVFVNEDSLPRQAIQLAGKSEEVMHVVEWNAEVQYPLAFSPRVHNYTMTSIAGVPERMVFALSDNRSLVPADGGVAQTRDSRTFGPVDAPSLMGKPVFIAWSTDPVSGAVRWNRIGLRVR
jgi:signal peptidase I